MPTLPPDVAQSLPIFKVWVDGGKHPPVALDRTVCVIGRREGVNLPLDAPQVSKLHALVVRTQGRVYLRDLASRNGVQRNGAPVQEVGLSDEDVIRIGSYTLRCASGFGYAEPEAGADDAAGEQVLPAAELIAPDGATYAFPSGQQTLLIGQREGCDIRLDDDAVAPVHAVLFEMDGKRYVRDLGTPRGTRLNDQSIHQSQLNPGDELRIGNVTLRYALLEVGEEAAPAPGEIGIADSSLAPSLDLVDSAIEPDVGTADSAIAPEVTLEDSRSPAAPAPRPERPISEYDFDVVEPDARRESTFHGEVVDYPGGPVAEPGAITVTPGEAKPERPEVPPEAEAPQRVPPRGDDDAAIPIAGFHDKILDEHPLRDVEGRDTGGGVTVAREEPRGEPAEVPAEAEPIAAVTDERREPPAPAPAAPAPQVPPEGPAAEEVITELVDQVTERVGQVSEKVDLVAARVERVARKVDEVRKDVDEVAETAGTLQDAWTEYRADRGDHPGTSEKPAVKDDEGGAKGDPEMNSPEQSRSTSAEKQKES